MPVQLDPDRALPPVVFERTIVRNEVRVVPSQPAADLLTGPGWELAEGNEHLAWICDHDDHSAPYPHDITARAVPLDGARCPTMPSWWERKRSTPTWPR
jgi:hypothetical protein